MNRKLGLEVTPTKALRLPWKQVMGDQFKASQRTHEYHQNKLLTPTEIQKECVIRVPELEMSLFLTDEMPCNNRFLKA